MRAQVPSPISLRPSIPDPATDIPYASRAFSCNEQVRAPVSAAFISLFCGMSPFSPLSPTPCPRSPVYASISAAYCPIFSADSPV
eukprot:2681915-Rhodomonas_salina.1